MFGKDKPSVDREVFTIFDSKALRYELPAFAINHHDIIRQFVNLFSDPEQRKNRFLVNAEDYSLFRIGTFDQSTGIITPSKSLEHIANLNDLRALVAGSAATANSPTALESYPGANAPLRPV